MPDINNEPESRIVGGTGTVENSTGRINQPSTINGGFAVGQPIIDPDIAASGDSGNSGTGEPNEPKRKRGRPRGSTSRKSTTAKTDTINGLENILYSLHGMLAGIVQTPELALDQTEAKILADGINGVARHYDLSATQKQVDWTNLLMVCGAVYGPRVIALRMKKKETPIEPVPHAPMTPPANETSNVNVRSMNGKAAKPATSPRKIKIPGLPNAEVEVT